MKFKIILFLFSISYISPSRGQSSIPLDSAQIYYEEVKAICDKDHGKLWGIHIYAPTLLISPKTLDVISNEIDNEGLLQKKENLYIGKFPSDKIIANSTTRFGGKDFTMVSLPLPNDKYNRNVLLIHEMFHYYQPQLGLSLPEGISYDNIHADEMQARVYFKLEWNALEKAVMESNPQLVKQYINDALIFREYRQSLFEGSIKNENLFELHEGLPEYTAHKLCSTSDDMLKKQILRTKERIAASPSYVRSFAYLSGLMYGYLLDKANIEWRKDIRYDSNLNKILKTAYAIETSEDLDNAQIEIRDRYDYVSINNLETIRKAEKNKVLAQYTETFTQKPILTISLRNPQIGFDPRNVVAMGEPGSIYPKNFVAVDEWGKLTVSDGGCLLANNWKQITIPAEEMIINNKLIRTSNWSLELNDNYIVEKVGNNYIIIKK
ncbi:hypothetical protein JGH11_07255 [Dysgonomonas sp. Marseille-P4677]|uniref:hypothetical protein n=1 Tax=Dysgonomonas sp. Marseille-P4677 TaxID=2364790 RepID=UPI00191308C9|nr:hypothetical protein [Dysgonomonas sp. Marseille-P4677]MBK5720666.1 hypothetical protein [Dysgonomonas sp. Marseille-P4677]